MTFLLYLVSSVLLFACEGGLLNGVNHLAEMGIELVSV
jgi:hypothetical protein